MTNGPLPEALSNLNLEDINFLKFTPEQQGVYEILTGKKFPSTLGEYKKQVIEREFADRDRSARWWDEALGRRELQLKKDEKYIKMGKDFEKILNSINKYEHVKKEWNKFLMYWRLADPDASHD